MARAGADGLGLGGMTAQHFYILMVCRLLALVKKLKIPIPGHTCCGADEILDDEHGNFVVRGNHDRALHFQFSVDEMVSTLPVEYKAILFKYLYERFVGDGSQRGHYGMLIVHRSSAMNSGALHA